MDSRIATPNRRLEDLVRKESSYVLNGGGCTGKRMYLHKHHPNRMLWGRLKQFPSVYRRACHRCSHTLIAWPKEAAGAGLRHLVERIPKVSKTTDIYIYKVYLYQKKVLVNTPRHRVDNVGYVCSFCQFESCNIMQ